MDAIQQFFEVRPSRAAGMAAGIGTQALFVVTVVFLFSFLRYGVDTISRHWLLIDTLLAVQFAIPHSLLLHVAIRKRLTRWIPNHFYGLFYCCWTCLSLLLMFRYWKSCDRLVWEATPVVAKFVVAGFYTSWAALLYSLSIQGLGFQTGWTQWNHWYRGKALPRRAFSPRSFYRFFRHPIYLSFLGLIWFTPRMTFDHALLTAIWTFYIFAGSVLKDRRMVALVGDAYVEYQRRVPSYPLMAFWPLSTLPGALVDHLSVQFPAPAVCTATPTKALDLPKSLFLHFRSVAEPHAVPSDESKEALTPAA